MAPQSGARPVGDMTQRSFRRLAALGTGLTSLPIPSVRSPPRPKPCLMGRVMSLGARSPKKQALGDAGKGKAWVLGIREQPGQEQPQARTHTPAGPHHWRLAPTPTQGGELCPHSCLVRAALGSTSEGSPLVLGCSACPQERGLRLPRPLQPPSEAVGSEHVKNG